MTTDTDAEIERLKTLINQNPSDFAAIVRLGNLYFDTSDAAQAIVYYSFGLRINPNQPDVWTDMGTMYWQNGNTAFAEDAYRFVIKNHPGFGNAYINLGLLMRDARHDPKQASTVWTELIKKWPSHPAAERARSLLAETFLQISN